MAINRRLFSWSLLSLFWVVGHRVVFKRCVTTKHTCCDAYSFLTRGWGDMMGSRSAACSVTLWEPRFNYTPGHLDSVTSYQYSTMQYKKKFSLTRPLSVSWQNRMCTAGSHWWHMAGLWRSSRIMSLNYVWMNWLMVKCGYLEVYQTPDSVNRCVFTWRTILPNFIPIRFETTELSFRLFEEVMQPSKKKKKENKMSSDIRQVPDLNVCGHQLLLVNFVAAITSHHKAQTSSPSGFQCRAAPQSAMLKVKSLNHYIKMYIYIIIALLTSHLRAIYTRRHLPYGMTQCYLSPDTSELAPPNPSQTGWY